MKNKLLHSAFVLAIALIGLTAAAQPFAEDIAAFKKADSLQFPPKNAILLVGSSSFTRWTVYQRFTQLFGMIRTKLPKAKIVFVSLKPSPSRWRMQDRVVQTNDLISAYMKKRKNALFINVYHKMLDAHGLPLPEIFTADSLHMNAKGYGIWQQIIAPHLLQ